MLSSLPLVPHQEERKWAGSALQSQPLTMAFQHRCREVTKRLNFYATFTYCWLQASKKKSGSSRVCHWTQNRKLGTEDLIQVFIEGLEWIQCLLNANWILISFSCLLSTKWWFKKKKKYIYIAVTGEIRRISLPRHLVPSWKMTEQAALKFPKHVTCGLRVIETESSGEKSSTSLMMLFLVLLLQK